MIGIYEIYIDVFLVQNVLMDIQLLILTLLLLREKIVFPRLLGASLTGGAGAVMILVSGMGFGMSYVVSVLGLDAVMLLICMRPPVKGRLVCRRLVMGIIYLHGMVFAYGKLMGARHIYDVTLTEEGENVMCRALFDTGNLLTDPVSGKPVSVVEETDIMKGWLEKYPQKYKIIPYQSVGNEHGLLEGIVVDELVIRKEQEQVVERGAVVAFYKGKLSRDGEFQMILNHSLMM